MSDSKGAYPWKIYLYGILMNSAGIVFGYTIAQFNNFFIFFMEGHYDKVSTSEYNKIKSLLNTFFNTGGFICCLTSSILMKKFGRKPLFIVFGIINIILNFIQVWGPIELLYAYRFCIGYIVCFYTILCTVSVSESLPMKYSAPINASFYFFIASGVQIALLMKFDWTRKYYYLVLWLPIIIELLRMILYFIFLNTETPRYVFLDSKKRKASSNNEMNEELIQEDTQKSIESKFAGDSRMKKYLKVFYEESNHIETVSQFTEEFTLQSKNTKKGQSPLKIAFSKTYLKQTMIGLLLNFMNQLSGINVVVFYSSNVFKTLGFQNPGLLTIIVGLFNVLGGFINMFISNRFGRKRLLGTGMFSISICYLIIMFADCFKFKILIPVGMCLFMLSFATSLGGILYVYQVEILPGEVIPLISNSQWVFTLLISYFTLDIINLMSIYGVYTMFFFINFIAWFLFEGYAVETNGKTLSTVANDFLKKRFWN